MFILDLQIIVFGLFCAFVVIPAMYYFYFNSNYTQFFSDLLWSIYPTHRFCCITITIAFFATLLIPSIYIAITTLA